MKKIAIVYGSDGGYTENVCKRLATLFGEDNVDLIDIYASNVKEIEEHDYLILASSTWHDGHFQDDWEDFSDSLDDIDFSNKTIALLSLGDQDVYSETFCDTLGLFYEKVKEGNVVGATSTDGYDFEESAGIIDGKFIGLCIDEDNQEELTEQRVKNWYNDIKEHFAA